LVYFNLQFRLWVMELVLICSFLWLAIDCCLIPKLRGIIIWCWTAYAKNTHWDSPGWCFHISSCPTTGNAAPFGFDLHDLTFAISLSVQLSCSILFVLMCLSFGLGLVACDMTCAASGDAVYLDFYYLLL